MCSRQQHNNSSTNEHFIDEYEQTNRFGSIKSSLLNVASVYNPAVAAEEPEKSHTILCSHQQQQQRRKLSKTIRDYRTSRPVAPKNNTNTSSSSNSETEETNNPKSRKQVIRAASLRFQSQQKSSTPPHHQKAHFVHIKDNSYPVNQKKSSLKRSLSLKSELPQQERQVAVSQNLFNFTKIIQATKKKSQDHSKPPPPPPPNSN
jgi:hypothetical protein